MKKKYLAMLLAAVMMMALLPTAFAYGSSAGGPYYPSKEERLKVDVTLDGYLRTEYVKVGENAFWAVQVVRDGSNVKLECPGVEQLVDKDRRLDVVALRYEYRGYYGWWDDSAAMFLDGLDFEQEMDTSIKTFAATSANANEYIFTISGYDVGGSFSTSYIYVEETIYWMSESGFAELAPEFKGIPGPGSEIFGTVGPDKSTEPENPSTSTFTDVPKGIWYYEAVQWAADKGYIQGYNGEFSPNGSLTRGAIFTILARVDNVDTNGGSTWYEKGMNWAVENGVSDGTSPTSDITLEMLVTMLYRYENKPNADTSVLARFSDSSSLHTWTDCREAMAWAVEIGLVEGSGGKLDPLSTLARSRGAVVLQRYCEKLGK